MSTTQSASNTMDETICSTGSSSIDALKEIVRNCQRNEKRLHELERQTRHERKKAERLLREKYRTFQENAKQDSVSLQNKTIKTDDEKSKQPSVEFYISFDEANNKINKISQTKDKYLHERVEKLLAGDNKIRTSRDAKSSKEREKKSTTALEKSIQSVRPINHDLSTINNSPRVRFSIPENEIKNTNTICDQQFYKRLNNYVQTGRFSSSAPQKQITTNDNDDIAELAYRCEDLLLRLHSHRDRATKLENQDYDSQRSSPIPQSDYQSSQPITLQQTLKLLRPEFISDSHHRVQHINQLREERERHQIPQSSSYSNSITHRDVQTNSIELPSTYKEMKRTSKKKYEQLPEVQDRLQQGLTNEIRRRNYIRGKIFRTRLRQHVLLHGKTNIDKSLTMIDA